VTRTFIVDKPADVVVGYLADFGNAVDWDPGTQSCERQDTGPVHVGSTWRNVSKFLGRETVLDYRLETLQPDRVTLIGHNKTATSTDDISVKGASSNASEISYRARIELRGLARLGEPLVKAAMERVGDATAVQMQQAIAAL
jgi:carbon monoxide dehydrogenase subunit G